MTVEVCYTINPSIMLWRGRNAPTFGRGTPCSLAISLLWPKAGAGMDSLSLMAFTAANLGKGCRDFVRRKNRGILKICGGKRLKSQDRFCITHPGRGCGCYQLEDCWPYAGSCLSRMTTVRFLMPIRSSLLATWSTEVLTDLSACIRL